MAFSKNPTMDTYSSEDIDLIKEIDVRAGYTPNKDENYINVFIENIKSRNAGDTRQFLIKRAGSAQLIAGAANVVRGSTFWDDQQKLYYACGNALFIYDFTTSTTTTLAAFFTTFTGVVGFTEYLYDDGTAVMVISDGTNLYTLSTTNTKTPCTDPDLPVPHDPNIIFLDGYIFVNKLGTGEIWNSDANDPLSWDSSFFINAEIEADTVIQLAKVNNYLVAFGKKTIEYFWDAGNATGSPLQRNDTPIKNIVYMGGLAQNENTLYFMGKDFYGNIQAYKMYDFKVEAISTPSMSRFFNTINASGWSGFVISYLGHSFYLVLTAERTYVYDLDVGLWTRIAYKTTEFFFVRRTHNIRTSSKGFQSIFNLNDGTNTWYYFDDALYQDSGADFSCIITTDNVDFGTMNRKNMHRLTLVADRSPISANVIVQWSDDDYQTYTSGVTFDLNQDIPCVRQLGNFRQRSFKLFFTNNTLFRIEKMVADINKGNS